MDLGSSPVRAFVEITLPIIAPALVSSWLLSFTLSLDDLVISSFVSGPGASTLPMVIYSKVKLGVSPDVNALASLIICLVGSVCHRRRLFHAARRNDSASWRCRAAERTEPAIALALGLGRIARIVCLAG